MSRSQTNGTPKTTKRRSRMRFEMFNAFVDRGMRLLTPTEANVWIVLFRVTRSDDTAKAAVEDIAARSGLNRKTVIRALKRLRELRMLRLLRRGGVERGPSVYRVFPFPAPEEWG